MAPVQDGKIALSYKRKKKKVETKELPIARPLGRTGAKPKETG